MIFNRIFLISSSIFIAVLYWYFQQWIYENFKAYIPVVVVFVWGLFAYLEYRNRD